MTDKEFYEAFKRTWVFWAIDMTITKLYYGAFKQQEFHYHMLEKWGSRYSKYYVKNLQYDSEHENYLEL